MNDFTRSNHPLGLLLEAALNFAALFFACMVCHGELARLKPSPRRLTEFYLMIAAGGALGGLFVARRGAAGLPHVSRMANRRSGFRACWRSGCCSCRDGAGRRGIICYTDRCRR